jgi:hypothetical protein
MGTKEVQQRKLDRTSTQRTLYSRTSGILILEIAAFLSQMRLDRPDLNTAQTR